MIQTLSIRNYAIIEKLEVGFSENLTIITGETGAGKSIMLGALGLIMGKRADTKVLYNRANKCIVEAVFDVSPYNLKDFFEENDLDYEAKTIIRREITPAGKSRAFVNDTPVRLGILQKLSENLIDLHQQFDTRGIGVPDFQLKVIDALAGNKETVRTYYVSYKQFDANRKLLDKLIEESNRASQEADFLQFQLDELLEAKLKNGEVGELEMEQKKLSNAEDIKRILGGTANQLNEDENCLVNALTEMLNKVGTIAEFHPKLPKLSEQFEGSMFELQELASEFQSIAEDTEYDEERLEEIDLRLDLLYRLQTKHHVTSEEELIDLQNDLSERLQGFQDLSGKISKLEKEIDKQETDLLKLGQKISKKRSKIIPAFEKQVHKLLAQLSMEHARLRVELVPTQEIMASGIDRLKFLFAPNKGSRYEDIKSVASGGELSRLALSIKSLVASAIPLPTLIFDEIDSGVSGEIALQMGFILKDLSDGHQVVSITHSPQIAAKANIHYFVHKRIHGNHTYTGVRRLESEDRILEIAKMLSGDPPSESAKENARELLAR